MAASKADLEEQIAALCGQAVWALAGGDRGRYLDLLRERRALEQKARRRLPPNRPAAEKAAAGPVRKSAGPLHRGGRPTVLDEKALQEAFDREVDMVDFPRRDGAPGWRTQADVCEWILKQLGKGEKAAGRKHTQGGREPDDEKDKGAVGRQRQRGRELGSGLS